MILKEMAMLAIRPMEMEGHHDHHHGGHHGGHHHMEKTTCLLYTSDAADE